MSIWVSISKISLHAGAASSSTIPGSVLFVVIVRTFSFPLSSTSNSTLID
jgi:hypothetical protein